VKQAVQVTILGQQYTVRSDSSPEQVRRVAALVDQQLAQTATSAPTADTLHIAVLALLNLAGSYLELKDRPVPSVAAEGMEARLCDLLQRVEKACSSNVGQFSPCGEFR
jgi:cell division protein ZapA